MASLVTRKGWSQLTDEKWEGANFDTYVLLRNKNLKSSVEEKFPALVNREIGDVLNKNGTIYKLELMPLTDIHLILHGNNTYVYLFSGIAVLILFIACINYMNLATARAMNRAREVGIRKVLGASLYSIVKLLSKEFTKLVLISSVAAIPLSYFIMEKWLLNFAFKISVGFEIILLAIISILAIAIATVSFQTIKVSLLNPAKILKDE